MGSHIGAFDWLIQWPLMTLNGVMTADPRYICFAEMLATKTTGEWMNEWMNKWTRVVVDDDDDDDDGGSVTQHADITCSCWYRRWCTVRYWTRSTRVLIQFSAIQRLWIDPPHTHTLAHIVWLAFGVLHEDSIRRDGGSQWLRGAM